MFSFENHLNIDPNLQNLSTQENAGVESNSQASKRKSNNYVLQSKTRKKSRNQNNFPHLAEIFPYNPTSTVSLPALALPQNSRAAAGLASKSTLEKIEDILHELLPLWIEHEQDSCFKLYEKVKLLHFSYLDNCHENRESQFNTFNADQSSMSESASSLTNTPPNKPSHISLQQAMNEKSRLLFQSLFSDQIEVTPSTPVEVQLRETHIDRLSKQLWSLFDEPHLKISAEFFYENLKDALECRHLLLFEKICDKGRAFFAEHNELSLYLQNEMLFSHLMKEDLPIVCIVLKYIENLSFLSSDTHARLYSYAIDAMENAVKTGEFEESMAENLIDTLLQKNASLNSIDSKNRMTPLMYAARNSLKIFKKMVLAGARLDALDKYGNGIVYHALESKQFDIVDYIKELILAEKRNGRELVCFNSDTNLSYVLLRNLVCQDNTEGVKLFLSFGPFNKKKLSEIFINHVMHFSSVPKGNSCRILLNHFGFKDKKEENQFIHFVIQSLLDKFIGKPFTINPKNVSLDPAQNSRSVSTVNLLHSPAAAPILSSVPSSAVLANPVSPGPLPKVPFAIPFTALEKIYQMNFKNLNINNALRQGEGGWSHIETREGDVGLVAQSNEHQNLTNRRLSKNFSSHFSSTAILFIEQGLATLIAANVSLNIPDLEGSSLFVKLFYHLILHRVDKQKVSKFVLWMLAHGMSPCSFDFQCHTGIGLKVKSEKLNEIRSELGLKVEVLSEHILFHFLELDNFQIMQQILSFATNLTIKNSKGYSLLEAAIRRVYDFPKQGQGKQSQSKLSLLSENESKMSEIEVMGVEEKVSGERRDERCEDGYDEESNDDRLEIMEVMFKRRQVVKVLLSKFSVFEISSTMMLFTSHPYEDDIKKLLEL